MPQVVTCILENDGKILLLKRSNLVKTYRGLWGGIAGYVEKLENPYDTAIKEIKEETGINTDSLQLIRKGEPIEFSDIYDGRRYNWIVHPFLFRIRSKKLIRLDWEHEECLWVFPSESKEFDTVPGLDKVITRLLNANDIM